MFSLTELVGEVESARVGGFDDCISFFRRRKGVRRFRDFCVV
jgi:hypothetical protein